MKWLCLVALVVNLLLFAYAGYALITVPQSEVDRAKAELQAKIDRHNPDGSGFLELEAGYFGDGPDAHPNETDADELERLLELQEGEPGAPPPPDGSEERGRVRTYDIDYMEDPYARGDAQAQGVEDAKEKMRQNPLR